MIKEEEENEEKGMDRGGKRGRLPISSTILALFQVECFFKDYLSSDDHFILINKIFQVTT